MNHIEQVPARQELPEQEFQGQELPPANQQSYFDDVPADDLQTVPLSRRVLVAIVIALGLFVIFGGWWWYERQQPTQSVIQDLRFENQGVNDGSNNSTNESEQMLLENGVKTEPVEILTLPVDSRWEDNRWRFELSSVHLAPHVADFTDENKDSSEDFNYLVFELAVLDTRDVGEPRLVLAHDYVNIRRLSNNETPLGENYLTLSPGQSGTLFVIFRVPQDELTFLGLAGILSNPYLVEIDVTSPEAQQRVGIILKEKGFIGS